MNTDQLSISVVVPCYNGAAEIGATLDALLAQTLKPIEIIVVDDGSSDNSHAVAAAYGGSVKVIRQLNAGAAVARHQGVLASQGEIVVFNDTGDISHLNRLQRLHDALVAHRQCVAAYGVTGTDASTSPKVSYETGRPLDGSFYVVEDTLNVYLRQCWPLAVGMNLAVRQEFARKCIAIPASFKAANDYAFQVRLAAEGPFVKVEEVLLDYEPTAGGISAKLGFARQRAYALIAAAEVFRESQRKESLDVVGFTNRVEIEWPDIWLRLYVAGEKKLRGKIFKIGWMHGRLSRLPARAWWAIDAIESEGLVSQQPMVVKLVKLVRGFISR